jgi:hypothetical protein
LTRNPCLRSFHWLKLERWLIVLSICFRCSVGQLPCHASDQESWVRDRAVHGPTTSLPRIAQVCWVCFLPFPHRALSALGL